jgi:GDPmannose 4,6-dehydratase
MKVAMIVGAAGQDGRLLADMLARKSYSVIRVTRNRLAGPDAKADGPFDVLNRTGVIEAMRAFQPDELYYLAAYHHSAQDNILLDSRQLWERSFSVHVDGWLNCLEAIVDCMPSCRAFYAASSLVFGEPPCMPQNEETPLNPRCVYGITKLAGLHSARFYRHRHGLFASAGILYNHESPLRKETFLSKKIISGLLRVKNGEQDAITLGDLSVAVDWGYAPDYVDAMHRILQLGKPDDFVIATGETHQVSQFAGIVCDVLGLDVSMVVREDRSILARRVSQLIGDAGKLRTATGWRPSVTFREMILELLHAQRSKHG